jgi:hypothetical protein
MTNNAKNSGQKEPYCGRPSRVKHVFVALTVTSLIVLLNGCGRNKHGEIIVDLEDLSDISPQMKKLSPGHDNFVSNIATLKVVQGQKIIFQQPLKGIFFAVDNPAIEYNFDLQNLRSDVYDQIEQSVFKLGPTWMQLKGPRGEWRNLDCRIVDCLKESKAVRMDRSYPGDLRFTRLVLRGTLKSGKPFQLIVSSSILNNPDKIYAGIDIRDDETRFWTFP